MRPAPYREMNDPLFLVFGICMAAYFARLWWLDTRTSRSREGSPIANGGLPGATLPTPRAIVIGVVGALILVAVETWGELALGVSGEQSEITVLFAIYSVLGAAIVEELVFRGFIVVDGKGSRWLIASTTGASVLFALAHPHLWKWEDGAFSWHLDTKGWFSTISLFVGSIWFYMCRFASWNSSRSLLPCFAAHAGKNLAVVLIKLAQGFIIGLW
jgi:uncharacterized protein